ncbi:hypothetical protein MC885_000025 [Smutsia gigantea]|nr:hypothetical protein MC885_000025 [Smutsia gigantea]
MAVTRSLCRLVVIPEFQNGVQAFDSEDRSSRQQPDSLSNSSADHQLNTVLTIKRHDSSGSGHSAFEPVVANGVPAAFVPRPGPLKRGLNSQSSDGHLNKRSRTSSVNSSTSRYTRGIPMSSHNAITSSYSSTEGLSQVHAPGGVEEVGSLHLLVDYPVFTSCLLSDAEITSKLTAVTNP